nr:Chain P, SYNAPTOJANIN 1 [Homo sapiens]2VJ0_P Chain P, SYNAPTOJANIN-1 [Homo sapiens]
NPKGWVTFEEEE